MEHLMGPYTAVSEYGGSYRPYPSASAALIYPRTIVGINAASSNKELATAFLECMLSFQIQSLKLGDGIPVNLQAMSANQQDPEEKFGRYGVSFRDEFAGGEEKGLTIPLSWPDQTFFDELNDLFTSADHIYVADSALAQVILQEAQPYFDGQRSLEDTVTSLKQKIDLFIQER